MSDARDKGKHYYEDFSKKVGVILTKTKSNIDGIMEKIRRTMNSCGCFKWITDKSMGLLLEGLDSVVGHTKNIVEVLRRMLRLIRSVLRCQIFPIQHLIKQSSLFLVGTFVTIINNFRVLIKE